MQVQMHEYHDGAAQQICRDGDGAVGIGRHSSRYHCLVQSVSLFFQRKTKHFSVDYVSHYFYAYL